MSRSCENCGARNQPRVCTYCQDGAEPSSTPTQASANDLFAAGERVATYLARKHPLHRDSELSFLQEEDPVLCAIVRQRLRELDKTHWIGDTYVGPYT